MTWSKLRGRLDLNLALVILLSVVAFAPLTYPGFFQSHSGFVPVFNLYDLERDFWGNWGWVPHLTGSPDLMKGEGPLPYLLAELLRWLGMGGVQAIKGIYLLGFVASGMAMYLLGKRLFGPAGGLLAGVVYVYAPFHLATVYVRGAFAEAWAFAMYPLVIWCWKRYLDNGRALWAALGVLAYAALASTGLGLALLFALFILVFVLVLGPSRRAKARGLLVLALALVVALLIQLPSAIRYGLPALGDGGFTQHFVYPFQLLAASWGYGASVPGWEDTLPLQLGLAATGLTLLAGLLLMAERGVDPRLLRTASFFVATAAVTVLLVTHPASLLWQLSGLSSMLYYPWQLLAFAAFAMSAASGATVRLAPRLARLPWQAVLATVVILGSYAYLSPRFTDVQVGGTPVAVLGENVILLTYQRDGPLRHGATVRFTLYWQGLRPMETDYTVFVHVLDQEGAIWAQRDSVPVAGERPTSTWQPGEVIEDEYEMIIGLEGPREGYTVEVGLYDPSTGMRLMLPDGATAAVVE